MSYIIYDFFILLMFNKVDCEWDEWAVGACSKSCGGGTRTNKRSPKIEADFGGSNCTGASNITEDCNIIPCPGNFLVSFSTPLILDFLKTFVLIYWIQLRVSFLFLS